MTTPATDEEYREVNRVYSVMAGPFIITLGLDNSTPDFKHLMTAPEDDARLWEVLAENLLDFLKNALKGDPAQIAEHLHQVELIEERDGEDRLIERR